MQPIRQAAAAWNRRIDSLWEEGSGRSRERKGKKNAGAWIQEHRWELLYLLFMGVLLFALSWILPFDQGPDENARYLIPAYIYRHGTLPEGGDPEIRMPVWGISYAFHSILPYIAGGYLMKLVGLFTTSDHALLMAARSVNVMLGMGFYWYVLQISKKLFSRKLFRAYFVALLSLLPQLLYLFTYVNMDGIELFSSALILYYWLEGLERKWDRGSCTGLAIGVAVCVLSNYNAYGWALLSIVLFVGSLLVFFHRQGGRQCAARILKRGLYITVLVFLLAGWWFIRSAVLYDGDFLGLEVQNKYAERYAQEEYKPSVKKSLKEQGVSLGEMLKPEEEGGREWLRTTYRSLIGCFGYYEHYLGLDVYEIHKKLFLLGVLGILLGVGGKLLGLLGRLFTRLGGRAGGVWSRCCSHIATLAERAGRAAEGEAEPSAVEKLCPANYFLLQFSLICCIIIPVFLSLYYSYTSDFQPQGRYLIPMILPVMYFTAAGTERFLELFFKKWFVWILMAPLFYAVCHVFLSAFVSVYIPTYVESLSYLADVRFPWFSQQGWLVKLMGCFIPG